MSAMMLDYLYVRLALRSDSFEDVLRKLSEGIVTVKLTYRKVDEMTCNAIDVDVHESVKELELVFVNVSTSRWLLCQILGQLQILNRDLCRFLEHNKSVDVPSVKPESATSVVQDFSQKFEDYQHYLVILNEGI